jgi:nitrogen fixation protein FixH
MNWGKAMAMAMIAFAGMMAYFLVRAAQNPEPLISEHYYEQELTYQDRIDAGSRTLGLSGKVRFTATRERITVEFPDQVKDRTIRGDLLLLRADVAGEDRSVAIPNATGGSFEEAITLRSGRYIAQLEWRADSVKYYSEEQLLVP